MIIFSLQSRPGHMTTHLTGQCDMCSQGSCSYGVFLLICTSLKQAQNRRAASLTQLSVLFVNASILLVIFYDQTYFVESYWALLVETSDQCWVPCTFFNTLPRLLMHVCTKVRARSPSAAQELPTAPYGFEKWVKRKRTIFLQGSIKYCISEPQL